MAAIHVSAIIQGAAAVLLLCAGAGGVTGYFKSNVSKATIALYKEDNEALRLRISTLEASRNEDATKIKALEQAVATLTQVVTQAEAIAHVQVVVDRIAAKVGV